MTQGGNNHIPNLSHIQKATDQNDDTKCIMKIDGKKK